MKIKVLPLLLLLVLFHCYVAIAATPPPLDFILNAPKTLIVDDASKIDATHVQISRALSDSRVLNPYATATSNQEDSLSSRLWRGTEPKNLIGVSVLQVEGRKNSKGKHFINAVDIVRFNKPCVFEETKDGNIEGNTVFRIVNLTNFSDATLGNKYKRQIVNVCAQSSNKLMFRLGNIKGGFLLPVTIVTYDKNGAATTVPEIIYLVTAEQ